jgi:hypothetical protein
MSRAIGRQPRPHLNQQLDNLRVTFPFALVWVRKLALRHDALDVQEASLEEPRCLVLYLLILHQSSRKKHIAVPQRFANHPHDLDIVVVFQYGSYEVHVPTAVRDKDRFVNMPVCPRHDRSIKIHIVVQESSNYVFTAFCACPLE